MATGVGVIRLFFSLVEVLSVDDGAMLLLINGNCRRWSLQVVHLVQQAVAEEQHDIVVNAEHHHQGEE